MNGKLSTYCGLIACHLVLLSSCIDVRDPAAGGPVGDGGLQVAATADEDNLFEGGRVTLTASAEGGTQPFVFRWDQNGGPQVSFDSPDSSETATSDLTEPGHYSFRVTVSDAAGFHESAFVAVDVLPAVTVEAPNLAIVGEPITLTATVAEGVDAPTFLWEVIQGTATIEEPRTASTTLTATRGETINVRLTVSLAGQDGSQASREVDIVAVIDLHPRIRVETNQGDLVIELDGEHAPNHIVNFLRYVDEGFYEGLLFHRNACSENEETQECEPFVLQGGGYRREGEELVEVEPTHEPVEFEENDSASNGELYTVSLALRGGNVDSGTTQFFINLNEGNDFLDDSGFTVFGRVVEGTDVVDAIVATERIESTIIPGEVSLPAEDIIIERIVRIE